MDISALLGLLTSGAGLLAGKPHKGAGDAWQTAAETYGLLHRPSGFWAGPKLSGLLSGNELTVDVKNRNTASAATRFRLRMPSQNLGLRIRKKGFWNSLRPRAGIGDRAFDSQVVVDSRNNSAVREFLTPERRTAIQSFLGSFKGAVVTDDEITLTTRGLVKKPDEMIGAIDAMRHVAGVITEEAQPKPIRHSRPAQVAAITPASAQEVFATAPESTPDRSPADENQAQPADAPAAEPDNPPEPDGTATASPDSLEPQENSPDVEEFCATVFAPGALSYIANQKFKESYEGRRIAWTGTLESITPFTFDFDFDSGHGIKAVLTLLESEAVGSRSVQAVIGLPPDAEGLNTKIGQPVSFTGRLLKVDGLAKRVVIADAELRS